MRLCREFSYSEEKFPRKAGESWEQCSSASQVYRFYKQVSRISFFLMQQIYAARRVQARIASRSAACRLNPFSLARFSSNAHMAGEKRTDRGTRYAASLTTMPTFEQSPTR